MHTSKTLPSPPKRAYKPTVKHSHYTNENAYASYPYNAHAPPTKPCTRARTHLHPHPKRSHFHQNYSPSRPLSSLILTPRCNRRNFVGRSFVFRVPLPPPPLLSPSRLSLPRFPQITSSSVRRSFVCSSFVRRSLSAASFSSPPLSHLSHFPPDEFVVRSSFVRSPLRPSPQFNSSFARHRHTLEDNLIPRRMPHPRGTP